jgi:hypothetical protein
LKEKSNKYLLVALLFGILYHCAALFFTLENTYDALIHLFFGNHYSKDIFEYWNYSWYTGFNVMGYPPLVHQLIGVLSHIGGLKFGLFAVAILGVVLYITGVYRFSLLIIGDRTIAGYAAILGMLSSSFVETLHVFGQLPSIVGVSILMHSLPEIYIWLQTGKYKYLFTSLSLIAVTVCSHHVTPIFGMVFFIAPLMGMVVIDIARSRAGSYKNISLKIFIFSAISILKRIVIFGGSALFLIVFCIFPYWVNSKQNPITQVPIPHGSRDSFIEVTSSGLVFFLIPWGIMLFILPYIFNRYFTKRYLFFGFSLSLLTLLGTGGTTPLPLKILGENAFNILTLDRFTLWASILSLPIFGEFVYRLIEGDIKYYIEERHGALFYKLITAIFIGTFLFFSLFTMTLSYFRPSQPKKIEMLPIVNFLSQDQHDHWRYLPLGFGDQMAYLSTQTNGMTVDGNYHSARRLPELTTKAVERLENSKFRGLEGIGSLQQFLTVPEKYNLKYIFSNDKFYDPILYFCGWHRLIQLENGIMVWEKEGVKPLPNILPKDEVSDYLKIMWGIIPILSILIAFALNIQMIWLQAIKAKNLYKPDFAKYSNQYAIMSKKLMNFLTFWIFMVAIIFIFGIYKLYYSNSPQIDAEKVVISFYSDIDFRRYENAFSYIKPNRKYPKDQFLLEVAVSDGLLNSYGKLETIATKIIKTNGKKAKVEATTYWVTPLQLSKKVKIHEVEKINGKWFIIPEIKDSDVPPDQLFNQETISYYKHGRRRITTQQTHHEDVLKQPILTVLNAKLIKDKNQYFVVGAIQNIDNVPADVVVSSILYDKEFKTLAKYNAMNVIKHKLMPKESTNFKIEFEEIAWIKNEDIKPKTFNPLEKNLKNIDKKPYSMDIHSEGNTAITDLYNDVSISDLKIENNKMKGVLYNYGIQEVTIPQLIVSYYDSNKELIYVDSFYSQEGIRIQRKQYFEYKLLNLNHIKIVDLPIKTFFVNGLPSEELNTNLKLSNELYNNQLQKVKGNGYEYIKIELNNFVGNPK